MLTDDQCQAISEKYGASNWEGLRAAYRLAVDASAKVCVMSVSQLRLMAGEMSSQEMRTVMAVLVSRAHAILALNEAPLAAPDPMVQAREHRPLRAEQAAAKGKTVQPRRGRGR